MDDPYDVLDCALRSRYLELADLTSTPFWGRLPAELRSALAEALAGDASLKAVVPLAWQVRARVLGKPATDDERSQATARLRLGLLYLAYREGRIGADDLLSRAFHVADSYVCGIDLRPFTQLRRELLASRSGESAAPRIAELFSPYAEAAAECVRRWGLDVRVQEETAAVIGAKPRAGRSAT